MRKIISLMLILAVLLSCTPAMADYNDHTDYVDWPIVEDGSITVSVVAPRDETDGNNPEDTWFWAWSEKYTGIKFEVEQVLRSAIAERKSLMLASGELPDLLWCMDLTDFELVRYGVGEGLFADLTPYMTEETMPYLCGWDKAYPQGLAYSTTPDGKIYSFPAYVDLYILSEPGTDLSIHAKYKEELGWEKNPETIDELVKYLYEVKAKHPELYPLGGTSVPAPGGNPFPALMNAFGYVWGLHDTNLTVDPSLGLVGAERYTGDEKEFVLPIMDDRFKEVVALMKQFYQDGILEPEFFTMTDTQVMANLEAGKYAVIGDAPWQHLEAPELFQQWTMLKTLTGPYTTTPRIGMALKFKHGSVLLNADIEPEKATAICKWLDFLYSDLGGMYMWCGPSASSADTIGMIGGYTADDKGAATWYDKDGNKVSSAWQMRGQSGGAGQSIGNRSHPLVDSELFAKGVTNRPEMRNWYYNKSLVPYGYDPNWGSGWYLRSLQDQVEPYRVDSTPHVMYFNEDDTMEINDLHSVLNSTVESELAKFITGKRDLAEWDVFQQEIRSMGVEDLYNFYKEAYDQYLADQGK